MYLHLRFATQRPRLGRRYDFIRKLGGQEILRAATGSDLALLASSFALGEVGWPSALSLRSV